MLVVDSGGEENKDGDDDDDGNCDVIVMVVVMVMKMIMVIVMVIAMTMMTRRVGIYIHSFTCPNRLKNCICYKGKNVLVPVLCRHHC